MKLSIPMKLPSLSNARMHWRAMDRLKKSQKDIVWLSLNFPERLTPTLPAKITLTRWGPRKLDDDNLASAFKYVRDQVAKQFGVDDGDESYTWVYRQQTCKDYWIEIEIETGGQQ